MRWILSLAAVGGFIGFIVYLNSIDPATTSAPPKATAVPSAPAAAKPATTEPAKPRQQEEPQSFRFYEMLPDSEVVPPDVEEYAPGPARQQYDYLVQTGSFRKPEDAERQRAQIAFQGMRAQVSRIDLDSGSTWYRVNVGPFTSRTKMNAALDKLVSINIQPLVRKIPKEG
ncbi:MULTISPECIES: SPOR domain-containing protein [Marinobacter]|uniref:SPOR domain-containing protein n=1 Tax=Marinobacter xestospongiae TaxID=994319 RepID=A0ABU3W2J0_9GAMM|nr:MULTISPECIES: SPOR domain-containing protein [Marinobacter]MDV2080211.1 SPOR domain-containing protein [Marinobacter xestospongiae]